MMLFNLYDCPCEKLIKDNELNPDKFCKGCDVDHHNYKCILCNFTIQSNEGTKIMISIPLQRDSKSIKNWI